MLIRSQKGGPQLSRTSRVLVYCAAICAVWFGSIAPRGATAAPYTFTIDSTQSALTLSGAVSLADLGTFPVSQQAPGSLTTSLSGTVELDTDLATTLTFSSGSSIAPDIGGAWSPTAGGFAGTQPAEYGVRIPVSVIGGVDYAATNTVFDATSAPIGLLAGAFDATQLTLNLLTTTVDFQSFGLLSGTFGTGVVTNQAAIDQLGGGTLTVVGNVATLIVPIQISETLPIANSVAYLTLTGQLVATAVVPEPSSIILAAFGGLAFIAWRRRGV
jgi:hypothetical protein